jgi:hypothetical protein
MKSSNLLASLLAALLCATPAYAIVSINSQGTNGAPISVSTAVKVLAANNNRAGWTLYSETQALRCTAGTYSEASGAFTAPSITPTSSVGFYIPSGVFVPETQLFNSVYTAGPNAIRNDEVKVEIDCISISGTAGNVDTWEELIR